MTDKNRLEAYKNTAGELPEGNYCWPLFGQGFDNMGKDGSPVLSKFNELKPNELLLRVDALGICFSDIKVINSGNKHIRMIGRNLSKDPAILGHEVSLTVARVGTNRKDMFNVGERYAIQPDIYYKGKPETLGYVQDGGLQQYLIVGDEIIESDEGCLLLPLGDKVGYAEASLTEPISAIEAAYGIKWRDRIKNKGNTWFIGTDEARFDDYTISDGLESDSHPGKIFFTNVKGKLLDNLIKITKKLNIPVEELEYSENIKEISDKYTKGSGFDDIIILGTPEPELIEALSKVIAKGGILALISEKPLARKISIDASPIHYDKVVFTGTKSTEITDAYKAIRSCELVSGGSTLMVGVGGPMGQIHTQRAILKPDGPSLVVGTDIDKSRIKLLEGRMGKMAKDHDIHFEVLDPSDMTETELENKIIKLTKNKKFDEIIILASVGKVIEQSGNWLGKNGIMNIFAGVPKGTKVMLDINGCVFNGHRWIGHSGTSLEYVTDALEKITNKTLLPNNIIAAVGGLRSALEGVKAVKAGRYAGKVIIYPQLLDFPLIRMEDMPDHYPNIAEKMHEGKLWTNEAEEELLSSQW